MLGFRVAGGDVRRGHERLRLVSVVATASQGVAGATTTVRAQPLPGRGVSRDRGFVFRPWSGRKLLAHSLRCFMSGCAGIDRRGQRVYAAAELTNLRCCRSEFASGIGNSFATIHQEVQPSGRRIHAGSRFRGAGRDLHRHAVRAAGFDARFAVAGETC